MEQERRPRAAGHTPLLVFGAGAGGQQAVRALLRDPNSPYVPVALLDDDPKKLGLSIQGIRVIGTRADLARASDRYGASWTRQPARASTRSTSRRTLARITA